MTTAKEICDGVPQSCLDCSVTDIHIAELAKNMTEWQELAPFLHLTPAEESEIVERYRGRLNLQKREALRKWKEKNGSRATYRSLIVTFCVQRKVDLAETLKGFLLTTEKQSGFVSNGSVIDVFQDYLYDCYSDLPHPSSLQWPFSSNQSYAELELSDVPVKGDSAVDNPEHCKYIPLEHLFSTGNPKAKRKVILIEGVAGAGKTTLSWYACKEWAAGKLFKDVKLLIHVSLSDPTIHSATKLADLIPYPSEEMRTNVARGIVDKRGKGVCFLLEGCDEAPPLLWEAFLYRFVAGTGGRAMVPNAHIILTARPGIPLQVTNCLTGKVIIRGFRSLDDFFTTCSPDNGIQLLEALKMKPELYSLCHLPLNAVILIYLYDFLKDDLPTTRTGLFDPLLRNFLFRHMLTRTNYKPSSIHNLPADLPDDIRSSLNKVSELAYKSLLQRKKLVSQRMLTEFGLTSIDNTFGFLRVHLRLTMYGPSEQFSFIHLSLQEFLAAFHISQMDKIQQPAAVKSVFDQNPLSPVLSFYAGLTGLVINEVRNILFKVLSNPLDTANIAKKLGLDHPNTFFSANPADDPRRHILALINCVYETQNKHLVSHINLPKRDIGDLLVKKSYVTLVSDEGVSRHQNEYVPFLGMFLYPTDCLSIGYFARHVSSVTKSRVFLEFSYCMLGDMEIKALTQELHKPASRNNVVLCIKGVCISTNALHSLNTLFNPKSCLVGLNISANLIEDIQIATKYFIKGFEGSRYRYLEFYNCCSRMIYYLVLLLRCPQLNSLNLLNSVDLFVGSRVTCLFSEALKYTSLVRLSLDGCGIDDDSLMIIAVGVCHKDCTLVIFEIDSNPYTDHGLTCFLKLMLRNSPFVRVAVLSVNHTNDEHHKLVELINNFRELYYQPQLVIGCMTDLSAQNKAIQEQIMGAALLRMRPDLGLRSPHH